MKLLKFRTGDNSSIFSMKNLLFGLKKIEFYFAIFVDWRQISNFFDTETWNILYERCFVHLYNIDGNWWHFFSKYLIHNRIFDVMKLIRFICQMFVFLKTDCYVNQSSGVLDKAREQIQTKVAKFMIMTFNILNWIYQ